MPTDLEQRGARRASLPVGRQRAHAVLQRGRRPRQLSRIGILALIALATGLIVFVKALYDNEIDERRFYGRSTAAYVDESLDDLHEVPTKTTANGEEWEEEWWEVWKRAKTMTLPPELAEAMLLETRPIKRPHDRRDRTTKYLAYRAHSGFHNQNALALAYLTNRTLLVPLARLGRPQPQVVGHEMRLKRLEHEDKDGLLICARWLPELEQRPILPLGEEAPFDGPKGCIRYSGYTEIGWDILGDLGEVSDMVSMVDRWNTSRAWFTAPDGLNIPLSSIAIFDEFNTTIYNIRIHERTDEDAPLELFQNSITLDELNSPPITDHRLLLFGSLHGSARILAYSEAYQQISAAAARATVFRHPLLLMGVDEVVRLLGGPDNYVGLHLRVGDGFFQRLAPTRMPEVFKRVLTEVFGFENERTEELMMASVDREAAAPPWPDEQRGRPVGLAERLICGQPLYEQEELRMLNTPIYIATDARGARNHPDLQLFFRTFPCAFTLQDFTSWGGSDFSTDHVDSLVELEAIRSAQDGVRLGKYLIAFIDAILAARSRIATIGCVRSILACFTPTGLAHPPFPSLPSSNYIQHTLRRTVRELHVDHDLTHVDIARNHAELL